jgi:hypothetical protein
VAEQPKPPNGTIGASFAEIAGALTDIAMWERQRIHLVEHLARTGNARDPGSVEIGSWLRRAELLTQGAEVFTVLADHEEAARALDPLLGR